MCLKKMGRKTRLCPCLPVHTVGNILHVIPMSETAFSEPYGF